MLKKLQTNIKSSYNSMFDDVSEEFYNRVLRESISYKRVSGYFSCKALSLYANGLDILAANNGYLQLIVSQNITEKDFDEIQRGYEARARKEIITRHRQKTLGEFSISYLTRESRCEIRLSKKWSVPYKMGTF